MHLLLGGEPDEELLLDYLTKDGSYVRGAEADDDYHLSVNEVLELGYDEAMSFLIVNPSSGVLLSNESPTKELSWKTELLMHIPFLDRNRGSKVIDPFLSAVMVYRRPYRKEEFFSEARLDPAASEAVEAVKAWYKRVTAWCRRHATSVFGWQPRDHDLFPGQFLSYSVNNRWALPSAMRWLGEGRMFCERDYPIDRLRRDLSLQKCATHQMSKWIGNSNTPRGEARNDGQAGGKS
jgi:hypothetical protein